jgi:hypothetical protein
MAQSYPPCAWAQSDESVFVIVRVPVEPDSVKVHFSPSGFTFSASSVPAFNMELSSAIIPETSSVRIAALGHTEITLHKRTAGNWTFLDKAETKIPTGECKVVCINRMMNICTLVTLSCEMCVETVVVAATCIHTLLLP